MFKNRNVYLLIFTFAVIALLLRPFLAYQIAARQHLTDNPAAMNSLLQRLIKKKDDHHTKTDEYLAAIQRSDKRLPRPVCVIRPEKSKTLPGYIFFPADQPDTHSKFGLTLHCYALYAQFRI